ncbi:MAG: response regulator [Deltaproteobacteria bacterium]|nr:response regulator [Deltaproteobacteria bacterium]
MKKKRVLIVDDESSSREIAVFDLKNIYDCDTAVDSFDAFEKICAAISDEAPYDVIAVDELMPGMDGTALLRILSITEKYFIPQKVKQAKFVIISGVESDEHLVKMYKMLSNRCAFVKKSFDLGVLLNVVNSLVA